MVTLAIFQDVQFAATLTTQFVLLVFPLFMQMVQLNAYQIIAAWQIVTYV